MTFPLRPPARLAAMAILAATLGSGCGSGDPAQRPVAEQFPAMTKGTPEELMQHVDALTRRYLDAEPSDPATAREMLLASTQAVIDTTEAVINDPSADKGIRKEAAATQFAAYFRRRDSDPKALDNLLAATDRVEKENLKTDIAVLAILEHARVLGLLDQVAPASEKPQKIEPLAKIALRIATMSPPPPAPIAPELLIKVARDCEVRRRYDLAQPLYRTFMERFPDDPSIRFAKGAIHRLEQKGQVVTELRGPGRGGKETSLEEYRGKVVLVYFWSTGFGPSVDEIPEMEDLRKKWVPKGFALLGVCLDPNRKAAEKVIEEQKFEGPQIFSELKSPQKESEIVLTFGVPTMPYKFVIDREGKLQDFGNVLADVRPTLDKLLADADETKSGPAEAPKAKAEATPGPANSGAEEKAEPPKSRPK